MSPDGKSVVFVASAENTFQLWLRSLASVEVHPIPGTEDGTFPFWSPDSRYIGFFANGKLKKVLAAGGSPVVLCDAAGGRRCKSDQTNPAFDLDDPPSRWHRRPMERRISTSEYFRMPETNRPTELVYGVVREPPAPRYGHQRIVGQLFHLLKTHVETARLGEVCVSPIDVVLDDAAALVVQPDLIFVSKERLPIVRDYIVGAPDIVVEVLSPATEHRDRTLKLAWYRRYGVRECWIADPRARTIDVVDCATGKVESFAGDHAIRSHVLPGFDASADECFL